MKTQRDTVIGTVVSLLLLATLAFGLWTEYVEWRGHSAARVPYAMSGYLETGNSAYWAQRLSLLAWHVEHTTGARVQYADDLPEGVVGVARTHDRVLRVRASLGPEGRFEVVAHEAAHLLQPATLSESESEVWAEAVAREVCRRWGLDVSAQVSAYQAQYKQALHVEQDYAAEIAWAATVIAGVGP